MTTRSNIILLLQLLFVVGCSRINNNANEPIVFDEEEQVNLDAKWKERFWVKLDHDDKNSFEEVELYVTKNKDTLLNQIKHYKNGLIDSTRSKYYDMEAKQIAHTRWLKGKIKLHSNNDTVGQNYLTNRRAVLTFIQNEGDSIYIEKYDFSDNYEVEFDFTLFNDDIFMGYIWEIISIHDDPNDPEKMTLEFHNTFIDNKHFTKNPFFDNITKSQNLLD